MELLKWLPINFLTIHYAWIIFMGLLSIPVLLPAGNMKAIDAYFFGASASTESGLNTVDVKDLMLYQQLYIYFIPMFTNLGFINAFTVAIRLYWFRKHLSKVAPQLLYRRPSGAMPQRNLGVPYAKTLNDDEARADENEIYPSIDNTENERTEKTSLAVGPSTTAGPHIKFDDSSKPNREDATLRIPGPRDREQGQPLTELSSEHRSSQYEISDMDDGVITNSSAYDLRRRRTNASHRSMSIHSVRNSVGNVAKSMLILDSTGGNRRDRRASNSRASQYHDDNLRLSHHVTIGRNSEFTNMTKADWELVGGVEYRSLKLLLKIVFTYYFGLHLFGAICLIGWIQYANPVYKDYLKEMGQDMNWWAFYSAQTMVDNLGFTLTPDSMISFRTAIWPMISMSFLAFAGNTLYPVCLRLIIWTMHKVTPKTSSIQESLSYLLNHPRRCYTLLFPSRPTWILFGIIFCLNFVDTLLIIVLDLDNPEVNTLPAGQRLFAAIFQAASSRHTGTSTFNLANVNPAVQFSLVVMMYIAIFPIAMMIRASNTYEEKSLGVWQEEGNLNESNGRSYIMRHVQNQLNFDLWYIFLGIFCICIAESKKIADNSEPAFSVWTVFFEVTSAYGNVGLSLGHPTVNTSLSGKFGVFSKLVICATMIRGRHRGLPYTLDRAIMLPDENLVHLRRDEEEEA